MRLSEFRQAVFDEFGVSYGKVLLESLVLTELGSKTANALLDAGVSPKAIWLALCKAQDVPDSRQYGVGRLPKKSDDTR